MDMVNVSDPMGVKLNDKKTSANKPQVDPKVYSQLKEALGEWKGCFNKDGKCLMKVENSDGTVSEKPCDKMMNKSSDHSKMKHIFCYHFFEQQKTQTRDQVPRVRKPSTRPDTTDKFEETMAQLLNSNVLTPESVENPLFRELISNAKKLPPDYKIDAKVISARYNDPNSEERKRKSDDSGSRKKQKQQQQQMQQQLQQQQQMQMQMQQQHQLLQFPPQQLQFPQQMQPLQAFPPQLQPMQTMQPFPTSFSHPHATMDESYQ